MYLGNFTIYKKIFLKIFHILYLNLYISFINFFLLLIEKLHKYFMYFKYEYLHKCIYY